MADLRLPYPNGPRMQDTVSEGRRKVAENLDAIADWLREQAREIEGDQAERTAEKHPQVAELCAGAIVVDTLKAAVR